MNAEKKATLNHDFSFNLQSAKSLVKTLSNLQDQQYVIMWFKYLMSFDESIEEMQLRNNFMHQLLLNIQEGSLRQPFDFPPPANQPLTQITHLLPRKAKKFMTVEEMMAEVNGEKNSENEKSLLMKKSPDGGVFLAQQPMPKDGSFCYLTISTKKHPKFCSKDCYSA